jgi:tetratricopeptide (TPR) repeat protein
MDQANKLLIYSIVASVFMMTGCDGLQQSDEDYLKKGADLLAKGDYASAELELKNAIQKNPDVADSYYYMALLNEKGRNFKAMRMNLQELLKLKPDHTEGRIKLAKVQLLFNDTEQALSEVDTVLKADASNFEALVVKAQIFNRQQKDKESTEIITRVLVADPDFIDALSLQAVMQLKQQDYAGGLSTIQHALELDPKNVSLHLLKIQLHSAQKDLDSLVNDYQLLSEIQPENDKIKYFLAKTVFQKGDKKQAEEILRTLVNKKPTLIQPKLVLLEFLYATSRNSSYNELELMLKNSTSDDQVELAKWALSKKAFTHGRQALEQVIKDGESTDKSKVAALLILVKLEFQQKDYDKSTSYLNQIQAIDEDNDDARILGMAILVSKGEFSLAEEKLNNFLWEKPKSDDAMVLLAKIYLNQGEKVKGFKKFEEALKVNPANKIALLPLVDQAIKKKHNEFAIEMLQRAIAVGGESLELLQLLARVNFESQNWDMAEKVISVIEKKKNGQIIGKFLKAQMLSQQKQYKQSNTIYQDILKQYPWHTASLTGMAFNYEQLKLRKVFVQYLDGFLAKHTNHTGAIILKARVMIKDKRTRQAIQFLTESIGSNPRSLAIYAELAELHLNLKDIPAALTIYTKGLQFDPNNIKLLMGIASVYQLNGLFNDAIGSYERVLKLNPAMHVAKNNLAAILIEAGGQNNISRAVNLTKEFKESEQPYFLDSFAWAQFKNGNTEDAFSALKKVVILAPEIPVFRFHLAHVYLKLGNNTAAEAELRQSLALGNTGSFPEAEEARKILLQLK